MRIRSIKPEFWSSEDIAALDWHTRLVFIGLWSYVDDNGVGRDIEKLIVADLFPLEDDPRDTLATVSRALASLAAGSLITRYMVDGKPYLHITTWEQHQRIDRPAKHRYPLPTCDDTQIRDTLATPSRHPRDTLATGTGEQGNRGTGEVNPLAPATAAATRRDPYPDPDFHAFWETYPRKDDKAKAFKSWKTARKKADASVIITGALRYADDPNREDQFTKYAATWLNAEAWDNGPLPPRNNPNGRRRPAPADEMNHTLALGARLAAEQNTQHNQIGAA